jgi:hypothetical protein
MKHLLSRSNKVHLSLTQRMGGCPLVVIHRNGGLRMPPFLQIAKIHTTIHHRIR